MKAGDTGRGLMDGGWWPRSSDPAAEFPGLVSGLAGWVGPVSRVSYNLDAWQPVASKVSMPGGVVRFEGFHSMDADTVTVIGADRRRVSLLVVPPATAGGVARAVLRSAARNDAIATVEDILTSNGVAPVPVPRAR
jgi:hypothetical protein